MANMRQTSVMIDDDKFKLLKAKGYDLKDIVDEAFNVILNIEPGEPTELIQKRDDIEAQIGITIRSKNSLINDKKEEIKNHQNQINELNADIERINNDYDNKLNNLKLQLIEVDKHIENAKIELENQQTVNNMEKDFTELYKIYVKNKESGNTLKDSLEIAINSFIDNYGTDKTLLSKALSYVNTEHIKGKGINETIKEILPGLL